MRRRSTSSIIYGASLLVHVIAGGALAVMDGTRPPPSITRITMREAARPQDAEPTPPPPAPEPVLPEPQRPARPEPRPQAAPPPDAPAPTPSAVPDFGVSLGNMGGPGGPGGIAVPVGTPGGSQQPRETRRVQERTVEADPRPRAASSSGGCDEPEVRARPLGAVPRPSYTDAAREAGIEGRVRVELTLDAEGNVTGKRVVSSLGHGLDEAALGTLERARFSPAQRCGQSVSSTFVISIRFTL